MAVNQEKKSQLGLYIGLALSVIGMLISFGGAIFFFALQIQSGSKLLPLPGLVLIDWAVLGIMGLCGILFGIRPASAKWSRVAWLVIGALLPLVVLGLLTIGPLVFISLVFFLSSTVLFTFQNKMIGAGFLGQTLLGGISNLGLLLLFLAINNALPH